MEENIELWHCLLVSHRMYRVYGDTERHGKCVVVVAIISIRHSVHCVREREYNRCKAVAATAIYIWNASHFAYKCEPQVQPKCTLCSFFVVVVVFNFSCCHCYGSELHNLAAIKSGANKTHWWCKRNRGRKVKEIKTKENGSMYRRIDWCAESIERYHCAFDSAESYATLCRPIWNAIPCVHAWNVHTSQRDFQCVSVSV